MRVAVIGLGVMGGSLVRGLSSGALTVVGWAVDGSDRLAAAADGATIGQHLGDTVREAKLVVLATPLSTLPDLASTLLASAPADAIVMDVASLQVPALRAARQASLGARWVSAHPMVGSERSGYEASRSDLYGGATVFLSADDSVPRERREVAARLWSRLDALPEWVEPDEHDDRMATVSHLPQMVATALADTIAASGLPPEAMGPGGRDTTRLASSSAVMWEDLLAHARPALIRGLRDLAGRLQDDASALERGDPTVSIERLVRAGEWRGNR